MSSSADIDRVIEKHIDAFKKPGALTVRPGFKISHGWITHKRAIVVTVNHKRANVSPAEAIPAEVGGVPTDVRQASELHKLRVHDPATYAAADQGIRAEHRRPEFPLERDAQTGQPLKPVPKPEAPSGPKTPYTAPLGVTLAPVTAKMSITCHASPDSGWMQLSGFLKGIKEQLTVGIYDFTSKHVMEAVRAGLSGKQKLSLVLDDPFQQNPSADESDEQTREALATAIGSRLQFAWAADGADAMIIKSKAIFTNAYHIKVAVKDHTSFWLSSGNWNDSNQPDIDPFAKGANQEQMSAIAMKSDRDWHVIVEHPGLAKTFEAYLLHDLEVAATMQNPGAKAAPFKYKPPAPPPRDAKPLQFFEPFQIKDKEVTVQPVLTPDTGPGNYCDNIQKLIESAKKALYIQTQYMHPPKAGQEIPFQNLVNALIAKVKAGLDVRIIMSEFEATGDWLEALAEAGIPTEHIRIQQGVHNKGFLVDSKVVALGSQNWSGDGVISNRDATLIINDSSAAQYYEKIFNHDWTTMAKQELKTQKPPAHT